MKISDNHGYLRDILLQQWEYQQMLDVIKLENKNEIYYYNYRWYENEIECVSNYFCSQF